MALKQLIRMRFSFVSLKDSVRFLKDYLHFQICSNERKSQSRIFTTFPSFLETTHNRKIKSKFGREKHLLMSSEIIPFVYLRKCTCSIKPVFMENDPFLQTKNSLEKIIKIFCRKICNFQFCIEKKN